MVIPTPLPDTDPDPDIRSCHQDASTEHDAPAAHTNTPPHPHDANGANGAFGADGAQVNTSIKIGTPLTPADSDAKIATDVDADTDKDEKLPSTASPSPSPQIRSARLSFVSTIEEGRDNDSDSDEGEHKHFTLWQSFKNMMRGVPILWIVPLICPVAWALHFSHQNPVAVFIISILAIVPLAGGLSFATEELAVRIGDAWGGLLNATFGNAVELLIAILALVKGDVDIVQASMAGSILSNILLVLGMSYFAGGLRFHEQLYGVVGAQTHISLLGISIAAILLPEAFHLAWPDTAEGAATVTATTNRGSSQLAPAELKQVLAMSRGLSIILLVCYGVYLTFQLWTHAYLFKAVREPVSTLPPPHNPRVFPRPQWVPSLRTVMSRDTWDRSSSSSSSSRSRSPSPRGRPVVRITERSGSDSTTSSRDRDRARARATPRPTRVHDFGLPSPILNPAAQHAPTPLRLDEKGVAAAAAAAAAATAVPPLSPSPVPVPIVPVTPGMLAHDVERGIRYHPRREVAHALPKTSALFAMIALFAFTGLAGITAECLVDSIDGMTEHTNISREFIGMILLPVIGNSVEHITAVTVSLKDRLNLSLSIAVGSSIQVSLCLIPLLTLLGWAIGQPMSLLFDTYETICLIIAVLLVNFALTGRTNYLQGFTLMMAWVAMAVVTFFYDPAY